MVDALAHVHVPLTLSETCTWPLELYWPNHPTRRSPAPTALLNWRVVLVTWVPVLTDEPCTHVTFAAAAAGVVTGSTVDWAEWVPPEL